jgi:hypothetical protein
MRRVLIGLFAAALILALYSQRDAFADVGPEAAAAMSRGFDRLDPSIRAALAPTLIAWIGASRDEAIERGVEEIPSDVRAALEGFVASDVLDRARWRVDDSAMSLQQALFRMGYTPAMTLDDVVIFANADDAADAKLWAHEIVHVQQYRDWGIEGFAQRYLADYEGVEHEAYEFRWQWMRATGRVPEPTVTSD